MILYKYCSYTIVTQYIYPIIKIYDNHRESPMCEIIKYAVLCENYNIESVVSLLGKYNLTVRSQTSSQISALVISFNR